jgi:hypothetical protein
MSKFNLGDKVKVVDQEITGTVVYDDGWHIVIEDDDAEYDDNRLEYRASDLELIIRYVSTHSCHKASKL